jgi:hypothetical protein
MGLRAEAAVFPNRHGGLFGVCTSKLRRQRKEVILEKARYAAHSQRMQECCCPQSTAVPVGDAPCDALVTRVVPGHNGPASTSLGNLVTDLSAD